MVLSPEVRPHWCAFKAGWETWRELKSCNELVTLGSISRTKIEYQPPNFGEQPSTDSVVEEEQKVEEFSVEASESFSDDVAEDEVIEESQFDLDATVVPLSGEITVKYENPGEDPWTSAGKDHPGGQETVIVNPVTVANVTPEEENDYADDSEVSLAIDLEATAGSFNMGTEIEITDVKTRGEPREVDDKTLVVGELQNPEVIEEDSQENRRYQRYAVKLHAQIICGNKVYETFTRDVSLGGVAVRGGFPNWVSGTGKVILSTLDMKYKLEFKCTVVQNPKGLNTRLQLYPSPDTKNLKLWLEDGLPGSQAV